MEGMTIAKFKFLLVFLLLPLVCFGASLDISDDVVVGEIGEKLDEYLIRITPFGFSGALLVAKEGKVILNRGYGLAMRSENIPNTSQTVFSTGSITKHFTAAGVMKLEMMRRLDTRDPIAKYFKNVPEDKKDITLHHLLAHAAGVVDVVGHDYEEALRDETVNKVLAAPLLFPPGERYEYSNAGFSLLAAVIEKVSGQSYEAFIREHLFKPAGMIFTGYRLPQWQKKVVAHWYRGENDNRTPLEKPYPYWNLLGNGGILSTTDDMFRWHLALLGNEVLSERAKKKMFTPYLNSDGYGCEVLDTEMGTVIQHDGASMLGNSAEMRWYVDAGVFTILFCNQSYGRRPLFEPVRDKIETLVFGGDVVMPPEVKTLGPEALRKFEQDYDIGSGSTVRIKAQNGKLQVVPVGQDAICALFGIEEGEAARYKELSRISETMFQASLSGDFEPIGRILHDKERRMGSVRELIQMRLNRYKERTGKIQRVVTQAALPTEFRGENAVLTNVQLQGERESIYFELYWMGKKNVGVGPAMSAPDLSLSFLPISESRFVGYHLDMARNFHLTFNIDENGSITRISFK